MADKDKGKQPMAESGDDEGDRLDEFELDLYLAGISDHDSFDFIKDLPDIGGDHNIFTELFVPSGDVFQGSTSNVEDMTEPIAMVPPNNYQSMNNSKGYRAQEMPQDVVGGGMTELDLALARISSDDSLDFIKDMPDIGGDHNIFPEFYLPSGDVFQGPTSNVEDMTDQPIAMIPTNNYQFMNNIEGYGVQEMPQDVVAGGGMSTEPTGERPPRFAVGFRFYPKDNELILYYLENKLKDRPLPLNIIKDVKILDYHPKTLVEMYKEWGENKWYFFTLRDRKYLKGSRPKRMTKYGFWKATGTDMKINYKCKQIGVKKSLVFYEGATKAGVKTDWVMHEYIKKEKDDPAPKPNGTMMLDNLALCVIQLKRGASMEDNEKEVKESNEIITHKLEQKVQNVHKSDSRANEYGDE